MIDKTVVFLDWFYKALRDYVTLTKEAFLEKYSTDLYEVFKRNQALIDSEMENVDNEEDEALALHFLLEYMVNDLFDYSQSKWTKNEVSTS